MSAIAVIFNLNGEPVTAGDLGRLSDKLAHRGTDKGGAIADGPIGFVHRMHFTTPESINENLPRRSHNRSLMITCDARLDNIAELQRELGLRSNGIGNLTESDVLLAAYEKWGAECAERLLGDFVFVIWDRNEKRLFAARDQLGVKHFYYYHKPEKLFAVASEIKALFELKPIKKTLDEDHLADYLAGSTDDKESTFFKGIRRLPACSSLVVDKNGLTVQEYWKPATNELKLGSAVSYQTAFREKLIDAVIPRLRSAYPVGSFLSGGLDSSAIVAIAAPHILERTSAPLETFSAVFPSISKIDDRIEETEFMESVVEQTGCYANFIALDDEDPLRDLQQIIRSADDPVGAPNVYLDLEIYRAAASRGVRVLLSGTDGDSTVGHGYEDFARLAFRGNYFRLMRDAVALSKNMPRRTHTVKRSVWHRGIKKTIPEGMISAWRFLRRRSPEDVQPSPVVFPLNFESIKPEIRDQFDLQNRIQKLQNVNLPVDIPFAESHWRGLTSGHFSFMLEQLEKISACFGIEPRYPFFDRKLIEFCIALPPGQRVYKGWTRSIFRHSMKGILPEKVRWRTDKSDLGAAIKINFLKFGERHIVDAIEKNGSILEKYLDMDVLRKAFEDYRRDPLKRDAEVLLLLSSVYLSNWLSDAGFA